MTAPVEQALMLAGILFAIGLAGLLVRRGLIFQLLCLEVMLNAAGLAFVAAGARWAQPDGQVMFLFVLTLAACEVAITLALVLQMARQFGGLDVNLLRRMRH